MRATISRRAALCFLFCQTRFASLVIPPRACLYSVDSSRFMYAYMRVSWKSNEIDQEFKGF